MLSSDNISILLVDDSEIVLKFARRVLEDLNLPIFTAGNGRQAFEQMRSHPAEILVTDLMMPEMNGFELIEQVRADEKFQQTHIIVMTALDQIADKVRALSLGANDYTVKPLNAHEFRARVQAGLREIRLKKQLNAALASLDRELRLVGNLQRRLLPKILPQGDRFRAAASYQPCKLSGGDYYDCFTDPQGRLLVTVADVSGHGASAAVLMAMFRALLNVFIAEGLSAAGLADRLNRALLDNIGDDPDFVSAFLGLVDKDSRRLNYCAAGHGDMLILGPEPGRLQCLPTSGTVLGCFPGPWEEDTFELEAGQSLILYTDGLTEAVNDNLEEYGRQRLENFLISLDPKMDPDSMVALIRTEIEKFTKGTVFADDVTLFVIKFL